MSDHEVIRRLDDIEARAYAAMFAAMPLPMAQALGARVEPVGKTTCLIAPGLPITLFNRAIGLGVHATANRAEVRQVTELYRSAGVKSYWVHLNPIASPTELETFLGEEGLVRIPRVWAKMARGTEPPPVIETPFSIVAPAPAQLAELALVLADAHGMPPPIVPWLVSIAQQPGWRVLAVLDGDHVVGGGYTFQHEEAAWLGMGGVLPSHRRKGGQGALMTRRITDAVARGATLITAETGEPLGDEPAPSLRNMARVGFRKLVGRGQAAPR